MWLVLFFVYKQKTAYERRISGWSSDVCSSDLLTIKYIYPNGTESITTDWEFISAEMVDAKGERIDHGRRDYDESVAQTPSPNKPSFLVVHAHNERQDKIGRASCRERVCQYV